jgi:integrase
MSVLLKERKNDDGTISQFLIIYSSRDRKRHYEFLPNLKLEKGTTPDVRQRNKERRETAKSIKLSRETQLAENDYDIKSTLSKSVLVLEWMESFAKGYKKKDKRNIEGVLGRFKTFLSDRIETNLLMKDFNENIVHLFKEKLQETCQGEGAKSYYARFRKMVKQALRENLLLKNPCEFVSPPKGEAKQKDVLTFEELQKLADTSTESKEVKRAFLFCSVTGLAWIDVKKLTWANIDLKNERMIKVARTKTKKGDVLPLNDTALKILKESKHKTGLVFDLPTANGANKSLKMWVRRAEINKSITWHCARHGFGTNLIYNGVDIHTTSMLLQHTSLKHTQRYVRASEEMNRKAVDKLPGLKIQ